MKKLKKKMYKFTEEGEPELESMKNWFFIGESLDRGSYEFTKKFKTRNHAFIILKGISKNLIEKTTRDQVIISPSKKEKIYDYYFRPVEEGYDNLNTQYCFENIKEKITEGLRRLLPV